MRTGIPRTLLIVTALTLASCGATGDAANDTTTKPQEPQATSTSPDTEPTSTTTTIDDPSPSVDPCPEVPMPDDVATTAPAGFDGDGDGDDDTLTTFQEEDQWWAGVEWAAGGSGLIMLDEAESMGAKAIGGYDLDGDGVDEAFIALGGPASGVRVQVFHQDGCGLKPVLFQNDKPFTFPVTGTAGTFTAAECGTTTDITLITATVMDPDTGTLDLDQVRYSFDPDSGTMIGEDEARDTVEGADIAELSGLRCGDLEEAMSQLG